MTSLQRDYWNSLAQTYHRITRISTTDFHYGPQIPGERNLRLLPKFARGQTALELGCGGAENSIFLARKGMECIAMDISRKQLDHAERKARRHNVQIRFIESSLETFHKHIKGRFDFIHSSHAFEFVEHPEKILRRIAGFLKPRGTLMLSTVHPLFNGTWVDEMQDADGETRPGLFLPSYFTPPDDIRYDKAGKMQVVSRAYPVASWFRWLTDAGLTVTHLAEPPAVPFRQTPPYTSNDWAQHGGHLHAIPTTIIFVATLV